MMMSSLDQSTPGDNEIIAVLPLHLTSTRSFPKYQRRNSFAGIVRTEERELGVGDIETVADRRKSFKRQRSSSLGFASKEEAKGILRDLSKRDLKQIRNSTGANGNADNSSSSELPISLDLGILLSIGNNDEKENKTDKIVSEEDLNDRRRSMMKRKDSWINPQTNNVFDDDCQDAVSMLNGRIPAGHLPHCSERDSLASGCASVIGIKPSISADVEQKKSALCEVPEEFVETPFEHPLHVPSARQRSDSMDTYSTKRHSEVSVASHYELKSIECHHNADGDDDRSNASSGPGLLEGFMKMLPLGKKECPDPDVAQPLIVNTTPQNIPSFDWDENSEAELATIEDGESLLSEGRDEKNHEVIEEAHNLVVVIEKSLKSIHVESPFVLTEEVIPRFRSVHQQFRNQLESQNVSGLTRASSSDKLFPLPTYIFDAEESSLSQKASHQNRVRHKNRVAATSEGLSNPPRFPLYRGVALPRSSDHSSSQNLPGLVSCDTSSLSSDTTASGLQYIDPKLMRLFSLLEPSFVKALERTDGYNNSRAHDISSRSISRNNPTRSFSVFQSCVVASCPMKYFYGNEDERDSDSEAQAVEQLKELLLKYQKKTTTNDGGVMRIVKHIKTNFLKQSDRFVDAAITDLVVDPESDRRNEATNRPLTETLSIKGRDDLPTAKETKELIGIRVCRPQDVQTVQRAEGEVDTPADTAEERSVKNSQEESNLPVPDNLLVDFDSKIRMPMADKRLNKRGFFFGWGKEEPSDSVSTQDATIEDSEDLSFKGEEKHQQKNDITREDSRASPLTKKEKDVAKNDLATQDSQKSGKDHRGATGRRKLDLSSIISDIPDGPLGSDLYFHKVGHDTSCDDDFDKDDPISNILNLKL